MGKIKINFLESFYHEWVVKLQLEPFPIKFRILNQREVILLRRSGYKAKTRWDYNTNTQELLIPKKIEPFIIVYELGHLDFPKKVGDMVLAPKLKVKST